MSSTNQAAGGGATAPTPPMVPALVQRKPIKKKVEVPAHGGVDTFPSSDIAWTGVTPTTRMLPVQLQMAVTG